MDINKLIIDLISNPLFSLIFPLIIAAVVKFWFDRKIEKVKSNHAADTFKFQTEINSLKDRENFKFNKLHDKRFEVLKDTYAYLNKSLNFLRPYVTKSKIIPSGMNYQDYETLQDQSFREAHKEFTNYFTENIIFFDKTIEELLGSYLKMITEIYGDYNNLKILISLNVEIDKETRIKALNASKKITEQIEPIKKEIENKFREMLGK